MRFDIITIFPDIFGSYFKESIIKRARQKKLVKINIHDLRKYARDRHKTVHLHQLRRRRYGQVDDRPYGGGPGMILMAEPIYRAIKDISRKSKIKNQKSKTILLSAKGKKFNQKMTYQFSKLDQLIIISGRYEGVDERVAKYIADQEISIGDYVLTGGELPAMVVVDAITRLIPGVIEKGSLEEESFTKSDKYHEYPHYTRPEEVIIEGKKKRVPKVLISGNHQKIKEWRKKHSRAF